MARARCEGVAAVRAVISSSDRTFCFSPTQSMLTTAMPSSTRIWVCLERAPIVDMRCTGTRRIAESIAPEVARCVEAANSFDA